ncbi:MAG: hypothetical protein V2A78_09130 [bacterium]
MELREDEKKLIEKLSKHQTLNNERTATKIFLLLKICLSVFIFLVCLNLLYKNFEEAGVEALGVILLYNVIYALKMLRALYTIIKRNITI